MLSKGLKLFFSVVLLVISTSYLFAQAPVVKSQEIDEQRGIPVLVEHLPDWENHQKSAVFAKTPGELQNALGQRPVLDQIDFSAGTEAVTAPYDAGKLLIIEYTSPQASVDADEKFTEIVANDPTVAYRRIGNYNVLVFDVTDQTSANALVDQVKYEKQIQWLGNNPFRISAERAFTITTADIFMSTAIVIGIWIGLAISLGLIAGYVYNAYSQKRRAHLTTYTDAGGMTRLNLDGFTPEILPERLLGE